MPHDFGHFEEDHLGKPYDLRLLRRLLPFIRPYRLMLALSICLVVLITLLDLSLPYLTKIAIDRYIVPPAGASGDHRPVRWVRVDMNDPEAAAVVRRNADKFKTEGHEAMIPYGELDGLAAGGIEILRKADLLGISRIAALFMGIIILHFAMSFVQMMIMEYTGQMVMHDLRMRLFSHVQGLSVSFFNRNPVGRLVTRVTNDVQNMYELFTSIVVFVFKDFFLLTGISAMLLGINWQLALVSFTVLPFVVFFSVYFANQAREAFRTLRLKIAEINIRLSETIQGIRVIQLFLQEKQNYRRFQKLNHENYLAGKRQIHVFAVFMPIIELLGAVSVGVVIWYGGGSVISDTLTLGALVAFISYMKMFFRPIRDIAEKYNVMQNAMASAERLFLLLDNTEILPQPVQARPGENRAVTPMAEPITEIRLDNVSFGYEENRPVLKGVSFRIRSGETLAIVGPTGSGKTSLINLILRFYDPVSGRVMINGRDIREMNSTAFRSKMALVMQEPFLFSASVKENILQGNGALKKAQIDRLLAASNCRDLVERLPEGIDTLMGESGRSVSSGERQLISIARAFARDPDLIILDEATSYIDSETEVKIQGAIQNLMAGRTAILVAHRISTARSADRIIVLHRGRVIESGSHDDLMLNQGFYARMIQLQHA